MQKNVSTKNQKKCKHCFHWQTGFKQLPENTGFCVFEMFYPAVALYNVTTGKIHPEISEKETHESIVMMVTGENNLCKQYEPIIAESEARGRLNSCLKKMIAIEQRTNILIN